MAGRQVHPTTRPCSRRSRRCGSRSTHLRTTWSTACSRAIAAEDLEFELLTLVETNGALAGVRHAAPEERDDAGAWMLEYEGPDVRVYVRLTRIEDRTRLDGWVVPVKPLTVQLRADGNDAVQESDIDEFGRFEFASVRAGAVPADVHRPGQRVEAESHPSLLDLRSP